PPGSRVTRYDTPERSRLAANLCTCVDFPLPSDPSNVMDGSRRMMSIVKQASTVVECARSSSKPICRLQYRWITFNDEKFLARETGTILVFVVGLCRGRPNQLDWRTQLRCP